VGWQEGKLVNIPGNPERWQSWGIELETTNQKYLRWYTWRALFKKGSSALLRLIPQKGSDNYLKMMILKNTLLQKIGMYVLGGILFMLPCSLCLLWISSGYISIDRWVPFLLAFFLSSVILVGGWLLIVREKPPSWLLYALLTAFFLRLTLGAVWFVVLPVAGYDSPAERKGYVMADAFNRDRAAWQLSQSHKPVWKLIEGLEDYKKHDQYGGMLLVSSVIYRFVDGKNHQPLLMVVITASFSALAVLVGWALGKITFGERVAKISAWGLALYPEAVLLGSSQMREAFLMTLMGVAFYGLFHFIQHRSWGNLLLMIASLLLCMPFSPPATAMVLIMLVIVAFMAGDIHIIRQSKLWFLLGSLGVLAMVGIWIAWNSYAPEKISNPVSLLAWWLRISASMQANLSTLDSGWIQKIFNGMPEWAQFPFMLVYGVIRPFLPAALIDLSSTSIWHAIAIWRALGWMIMLPFFLYAPIMLLKKPKPGKEQTYAIGQALTLVVWLGMLIASLRGGADLWDNPRYRVMFVTIQIVLASWVWMNYRENKDVWLLRIIVFFGLVLLWFVPWYLRRYTAFTWPIVSFFKTLALGIVSGLLYLIWEIVRNKHGEQE
jgi:hypothetical protein